MISETNTSCSLLKRCYCSVRKTFMQQAFREGVGLFRSKIPTIYDRQEDSKIKPRVSFGIKASPVASSSRSSSSTTTIQCQATLADRCSDFCQNSRSNFFGFFRVSNPIIFISSSTSSSSSSSLLLLLLIPYIHTFLFFLLIFCSPICSVHSDFQWFSFSLSIFFFFLFELIFLKSQCSLSIWRLKICHTANAADFMENVFMVAS